LGSKAIGDLEGVKKRREGRDRGRRNGRKGRGGEGRGGEGPHSIFLPEGPIGCLAATVKVIKANNIFEWDYLCSTSNKFNILIIWLICRQKII
jgi:hypothetical protein